MDKSNYANQPDGSAHFNLLQTQSVDEDPLGALNSWNDSFHHCEWQGVICGGRHPERVVSLNLMSKGLGGLLSPHVGNLSFLRSLVLQNNSFRGEIPQSIGHLFRLRHLVLSNNSFGGQMPTNLSQCSNLEILNLIDNQLVGKIPDELGSLSKLQGLGLAINSLAGSIPHSIGNLSQLYKLSLRKNGLQGEIPKTLSKLHDLSFVQLANNQLTGEIPLAIFNMSGIFNFRIENNQLRGSIPPYIGDTLPSLVFLDFHSNLFTGVIPPSLSNASGLQYIYYDINNFHGSMPANIGRLKSLRVISLTSNELRDDFSFITPLTNCSRLEVIQLDLNFLEGLLPDSIGNLSNSVRIISMSSNIIYGTIPPGIGNLFNLSYLNLSNNSLGGSVPSCIGALHNLYELYLSRNMLTGEIPSSIGNLTLLNRFYLPFNHFYGEIPQSLGNCRQLIELELSNNNLSGSIPGEVLGLFTISIIFSLAHNQLSGSLSSQVGSMINLGQLDLSYNKLIGPIPSSIGKCLVLGRLSLAFNSFHGEIPLALSTLRGLQELDVSHNNLSGEIPSFLTQLTNLKYLNVSSNKLEGEVPKQGVFLNASAVSVFENRNLCGGIAELNLPSCKSNKVKVIAIVTAVLSFFIWCLCLSIFWYRRKKLKKNTSSIEFLFEHKFSIVSYKELFRASDGFSENNVIGKGRYSTIYKATTQEGGLVAVKVLNLGHIGASKSFISECRTLGAIRHRNLVKIVNVCSSMDYHGNDFKALLYEYMANGSLENWIHQGKEEDVEHEHEHGKPGHLGLMQRLDIAIDTASAIEYLHEACSPKIVHGDLKPSNVLLDNEMMGRVGDFGLATISSPKKIDAMDIDDNSNSVVVRGSVGYIPPEYGMGDMVSTQGDMYSYGILLLEMLTGRRPTEETFKDHLNLHNFVKVALPDRVMEIVDLAIINGESENDIERMRGCVASILRIGVVCSMELPQDRMDMTEALKELHKVRVRVIEMMLQPASSGTFYGIPIDLRWEQVEHPDPDMGITFIRI
ncbi:putative receptor-like protein kinase At3g47110 [Eucalyptus grandis]|uniref:putative receptor-like protein kinase At3g47110 n=1 Tax=Eucalyptus grandis TaxID=71139 RepID=UPI00192EB1B5|nr:putative receptor-like protein kinase At3g47110 [Eucalyptus grandis]